jgi:hypothetical protein
VVEAEEICALLRHGGRIARIWGSGVSSATSTRSRRWIRAARSAGTDRGGMAAALDEVSGR